MKVELHINGPHQLILVPEKRTERALPEEFTWGSAEAKCKSK